MREGKERGDGRRFGAFAQSGARRRGREGRGRRRAGAGARAGARAGAGAGCGRDVVLQARDAGKEQVGARDGSFDWIFNVRVDFLHGNLVVIVVFVVTIIIIIIIIIHVVCHHRVLFPAPILDLWRGSSRRVLVVPGPPLLDARQADRFALLQIGGQDLEAVETMRDRGHGLF